MKAVILAAGFGTRLRPLTDEMPKPLLPVGGRPMIEYNLLLLKKYGVKEVVINLHHFGEKIIKQLGSGTHLGLSISYSQEKEILGTGGGIKKAATTLGDDTFIVINGDILMDIDLDKVLSFHRSNKSQATMVLRETDQLKTFGAVEIDACNQIQNILGKIKTEEMQTRKFMFTGLHIIEPAVLDYIPGHVYYSIIETYLEMIAAKENLFGYITKGYWNDLGQIDRYEQVNQALESGQLQLAHIK